MRGERGKKEQKPHKQKWTKYFLLIDKTEFISIIPACVIKHFLMLIKSYNVLCWKGH